jgi:transposase
MPAALSADLRRRLIAAYQAGEGSLVMLAQRFKVGPATAGRWWARFRDSGEDIPHRPGGGNRPILDGEDLESIDLLIADNPALTVLELVDAFVADGGRRVSRSTMSRALAKLELTRKKTVRASRRSKRIG